MRWWGVVFWVKKYTYRYGFIHSLWSPRLEIRWAAK